MKGKALLIIFLICLFILPAAAGLVGKSEYDVVWRITVIDCNGGMRVYNNCRITNLGQSVVSFMPDQGQIASGNGREIIVTTNDGCTRVIKEQIN
jgi:hypothetical protein